jgi:uncharacterized Zn finger protein
MGWGYYPPYVSAAQRRASALREVRKLAGVGKVVSPVEVSGRKIASTFWGKAWCDNLESYSDFENRLPRGRTYVRNGSVLDLQIEAGKVTSLVSGSRLYRITIQIRPLAAPHWKRIKAQCGGLIGSLVELLQGRISQSVMEIVTRHDNCLFPSPKEIEMSCSCPDWAGMCKHVAATLYGVGSRLDCEPELLFKLRDVDHLELIAQAGSPVAARKGPGKKTIASDRLADVFGIELEAPPTLSAPTIPSKAVHREKPAPASKERAKRDSKTNSKERKPQTSAGAARSRKRSLTAAARNLIAQAQKSRWVARRKASLSENNSASNATVPPSPAPIKQATKAMAAELAGGKPRRRDRGRAIIAP